MSESDSGSESESDNNIKFEVTEYNNHTKREKTYVVMCGPKSVYSNRKKLLCFSVINDEYCKYGNKCTYAHDLDEQLIELDNLYVYQIILDMNLMNFFSLLNPKTEQIYKKLLFYTNVCAKCVAGVCMGGYNCKYGTHDKCLKICKNDLLTGQCINNVFDMHVPPSIINKINQIEPIKPLECYVGCINGHHLSERNFIPYYKYIEEKEYSKKTTYQSVRYISSNSISSKIDQRKYTQSSESTDEEISRWFDKKNFSSESESSSHD